MTATPDPQVLQPPAAHGGPSAASAGRAGAAEPAKPVVPLAKLLEAQAQANKVPEIGGRTDGPDPTRYGDWEKNGRCIDF